MDFIIINNYINNYLKGISKRSNFNVEKYQLFKAAVRSSHSYGSSRCNFGRDSRGFMIMDDTLRMSTSVSSEPFPCSVLRCFVSRIKRTVSLRVKCQCYAVWGENKRNQQFCNSTWSGGKKKLEEDPQQLYPECCYMS